MKKKIILIGISSFVCMSAVAVAIATTSKKGKVRSAVGSDEYYSITINAEDVTTSTSLVSGSYVAYTDQLHNPITFNYENIKFEQDGEDKYLVFGENSWFGNDKDSQIRKIQYVNIDGDGSLFSYDYGWDVQAGSIAFTGDNLYDWANNTDISCGEGQNYFKVMYRSDDARISKIVFTYSKDCAAGVNPFVIQGGLKFKKHSTYAQLMGFAGSSFANVTVPDEVDGLPVTAVDHHAFYYDSTIQTITLGENVTLINNNAFQYATSLTTVNGLNHVTTIFDYAFQGCYNLTGTLVFPEDMSYVGNYSFMFTDFTSISFPDTCNPYVGTGAFRDMSELVSVHYGKLNSTCDDMLYCDKLETITVTAGNEHLSAVDNVLYLDNYVLRIAQNRAETSFTLPAGCELTGYCAYGASTLETLVLNNDIYEIPDYCFDYCTALTSITFGTHADFVIHYAFNGCSSLETLTIPSNVSTIYQCAFQDCENLKTVIFEEGCTRLDNQVFKDCIKLEKVLLPTTLTNVGNGTSWAGESEDVFDGCTKLTKVLTRLEEGEDYTGDFASGWLGGRALIKHSDTLQDCDHWRMDATYGPQVWRTAITFKTNYGTVSGEAMYMFGTFNDWNKEPVLRMSYADGIWSIDIEISTCIAQEFKCYKASWDDPDSNNVFENNNHSYTFLDVDTEYWCTDF